MLRGFLVAASLPRYSSWPSTQSTLAFASLPVSQNASTIASMLAAALRISSAISMQADRPLNCLLTLHEHAKMHLPSLSITAMPVLCRSGSTRMNTTAHLLPLVAAFCKNDGDSSTAFLRPSLKHMPHGRHQLTRFDCHVESRRKPVQERAGRNVLRERHQDVLAGLRQARQLLEYVVVLASPISLSGNQVKAAGVIAYHEAFGGALFSGCRRDCLMR